MTSEAVSRYGNIKAAYPEKAAQLLILFGQALQSGELQQVDDDMLKQVLAKLAPKNRQTKIRRV